MAYIYKITNKINNKMYIGLTKYTVEYRFKEHCRKKNNKHCYNYPLYRAMRKYGDENFFVEEIEETDNPKEREIYWIDYFDTYNNGYNATRGGEDTLLWNPETFLKLWDEGKTLSEINFITNASRPTISKSLHSNGIIQKEIEDRGRGDAVLQYDLKGNFIKKFENLKLASDFFKKQQGSKNKSSSSHNITACC